MHRNLWTRADTSRREMDFVMEITLGKDKHSGIVASESSPETGWRPGRTRAPGLARKSHTEECNVTKSQVGSADA